MIILVETEHYHFKLWYCEQCCCAHRCQK